MLRPNVLRTNRRAQCVSLRLADIGRTILACVKAFSSAAFASSSVRTQRSSRIGIGSCKSPGDDYCFIHIGPHFKPLTAARGR
jgi:hypothetical protein